MHFSAHFMLKRDEALEMCWCSIQVDRFGAQADIQYIYGGPKGPSTCY